ncbi:MAG: double-strand break repair protein AddB [Phenylobacterium sp.]|uniref:double-strand break repair protein AddB n=1 Tax=Phenylobacterium sp. TaxID=1871053 RepID=UPI00391BED54
MSGAPLFDRPGPRWFNIPAHRPFVSDLAKGLFDALSPFGPEALSDATVLTPTRRGARALADAFLAVSGGRALLPPQIRPIGDLDEGEPPFEPGDIALDLPAAIEPLRRRLELTRLVKGKEALLGRELDAAAALELADALGAFLDSLQIEEVSADGRLADLADGDLAEHWQVSRQFLEAALEAWPKRLDALGLVDVSQRRVILLRRLAETWDQAPPPGVLVAAGSTGTAPATADLLKVIAAAPQGAVVLPGLDESLADAAWAEVDEQHPQGAMKRLLARAGVERKAVQVWPASARFTAQGRWRRRVVNEALRPAERTADWLDVIAALRAEAGDGTDPVEQGLAGLSVIAARAEEAAAATAALLLREALETPGLTAALVTPDKGLARRVAAKLARWGVTPDSSVGEPLAACRCGVLAGLVAKAAAQRLDPVTLLALVKHPLVRLGLTPEALEAARIELELHGLRGPRPADRAALEARLQAKGASQGLDLARRLQAALSLLDEAEASPAQAAGRLAETMEALAAGPEGGAGDLWAGPGGEALARLLAGLIEHGEGLPPATPRGFADLLTRLTAGETIRTGGATHSRLRILGAMEARLVRSDRLILAGLEEGVWPQGAPVDPFLSRPMRNRLGLPPPERRVGLAAHDFAQAACAPDVVLLHSERREGAPAVKSRWLWRLETLARGAGVALPGRPEGLDWAHALDAAGSYAPVRRPAPSPPLADRPRKLAVTRVEALTRDPYAVWARDILKLYLLDRPDEAVEARARGTAIHKAFERFALDHPTALPADAAAIFQDLYVAELAAAGMPREALARETALAREAATWVAELEARRRADGRTIHVEREGAHTIPAPGGPFTVTAKADRIEIDPQGFGHILDYKTGRAPSKKVVEAGFSPQLTLTAAILAAGGFPGLPAAAPGDLTYLEVTGRRPAGREEVRAAAGEESADAAARALDGLARLVAQFDAGRPYASRTAPQFVKLHVSDYDHLARVFEWSTSGDDGDET